MRWLVILFFAFPLITNLLAQRAFGQSNDARSAQHTHSSPTRESNPRAPIPTRQSAFGIPFVINEGGELPREVQLFVSENSGATWQQYGSKDPSSREFLFRAVHDGEYWFAVRTIDQSNRPHPSGNLTAELKVLVDTVPPKLEFDASAGAAGEINATWRFSDENVATETLLIQFQEVPAPGETSSQWKQVAIDPLHGSSHQTTYKGQTIWFVDDAGQSIQVRASVYDRAGNVAEVNRRIFLPRAATQPLASRADSSFVPPEDPFAAQQHDVDADSTPWPPKPEVNSQSNQQEPDFSFVGNATTRDSAQQPLGNPPQFTEPIRPRKWNDLLPEGEQLRMSNQRQFTLDYAVDSVGPTGVAKVELWVTRDGGQIWENWGIDKDNSSPFQVEVDREGLYGFRVAITSGLGFSSPPPRPGDLADIWVGVDQTKPMCQITAVPFGSGINTGQILVQWDAYDQHLKDRPISLFYSETADGPWDDIAKGLPNTGKFNWRVDPGVGREVFLRLEVRDDAGNVNSHQLTRPVNLEGLRPRGRIKNFQAIRDQ